MQKSFQHYIAIILLAGTLQAKSPLHPFTPEVPYETALERAKNISGQMTLDEKIAFIKGYKIFFIRHYPEYNIPLLYLTDATQGIHIRNKLDPTLFKQMKKSVAFPCPILLASTWNKEQVYRYAKAIGEECRAGGIHVLLGPGLNMYRNSQCGRNFEYMGEDPYLTARIIENYVTGVQNTGTMATLKHFIANNTDFYRRRSNSIIDERTLHEIYLPGFKAGVDAGVLAVMTAYNLVNGEWAGQSEYVIKHLLRGELGFRGLVMSDWRSVWDTEKIINSGLDIEMPSGASIQNVIGLMDEGKISESQINTMVKNIITASIMQGLYDRPQKDEALLAKFPEHEQIALNTAREGIVLLKNRDSMLPLKKKKTILATGKYIGTKAVGGGSGYVEGYDYILMKDALSEAFGNAITFSDAPSDEEIKNADVVLLSTGTHDSEGSDRPFDLPTAEDERIQTICALNPNTVVIVNSGSGINMSRWADKAAAILYAWYPGQIGNVALAEILTGKTNPSGKLPITIEKDFKDSPAYGYLPEADTLYSGRAADEMEKPLYDIVYKEGIFTGYRWYEKKNIAPLFPFGHGLSYTEFKYDDLKVSDDHIKSGDPVTITFSIKNTGKQDGMETAQLYVSDLKSSVERPVKELKGYTKKMIKRGKKINVEMTLDPDDFSYWYPKKKAWTLEPGEFEILIGASSQDIRLKKTIEVTQP